MAMLRRIGVFALACLALAGAALARSLSRRRQLLPSLANALEDNVKLYRVVGGRRIQIEGWSGRVASGSWHTLAVEARGNRLQVFWEGKPILDATDDTFKEAGKVGVWTKADSVTFFDALSVTALQ